jgi:hypothetical protein
MLYNFVALEKCYQPIWKLRWLIVVSSDKKADYYSMVGYQMYRSPVDILPNADRTKTSKIELILLKNKLEHIILRFHREKINFSEGADFSA